MILRPATNADRDAINALIGSIYAEYGERLQPDRADSDLQDIERAYATGYFMVLVDGNHIIQGTVALVPSPERPNACELKRVYLEAALRGAGTADVMLDWACETALSLHRPRMECWSDTRFERAHAFYAKRGFQRGPHTREMLDGWAPYREYFFFKDL